MARPDSPHFAFPFKHGAVVEQDTSEHVLACESVIANCPVGFRIERPEFGIPWPEYRQVIDPEEIVTAMQQFEPRSQLTGTQIRSLVDGASTISIEVQAG